MVSTPWWDEGKRFLKAGVVEMIMKSTLRREYTTTRLLFMNKLGVTLTEKEKAEVVRRLDQAGLPEDTTFLSGTECNADIGLLTVGERVDRLRRRGNRAMVPLAAVPGEYEGLSKPKAYYMLGSDGALFERHVGFRAWSQWEKLLFACPIPTLVPPDYVPGTKLVPDDDTGSIETLRGNDDAMRVAPGKTQRETFFLQARDVLSCKDMVRSYKTASEFCPRSRWFFLTRALHGVLAWQSCAIQVLFPSLTFLALAMVYTEAYCVLHLGACVLE
jgi:hypothetical protein